MKRYVVLLGARPDARASGRPAAHQSAVGEHDAFQRHVIEHGHLRSRAALGGADTATTVRAGAGGSRVVVDGPLGAVSDELVGFYDVELPDLDAAIAAARLLPAACDVEIRPVLGTSGPGVA